MSGYEESAYAAELLAEEAATSAAAAEGAGGAAAAGSAGAYGAGSASAAYGAGAYGAAGAGSAAAGYGGGSLAEQLAMQSALGDAGAYGAGDTVTGGLLGDAGGAGSIAGGPGGAAESGSGGNAFASDYDKYKQFAQQGFRNLGGYVNKLPPQATGLLGQMAMGTPPQQPTNNIQRPMGGGAPAQPANPYGNQQLPTVTPYAPAAPGAGPDDAEMRRRYMLMMQQRGMR